MLCVPSSDLTVTPLHSQLRQQHTHTHAGQLLGGRHSASQAMGASFNSCQCGHPHVTQLCVTAAAVQQLFFCSIVGVGQC